MNAKEVAALRHRRLTDDKAREAYYRRYKCQYCGECPSIHCDEHSIGGPACTPCRRDYNL